MKQFFKSEAFLIGLAMFSMFFGSGNLIFPLAVGQYAGDKNLFAITGLILTAAVIPIIGVLAMILFDGSYKSFFGRLGKTPGFLLALSIICLLGPFGTTPRCIALSYINLKSVLPISPVLFSAISCVLIFLFAARKNHILTLLGWVMTPLLLGSLMIIIGIGLFKAPETPMMDHTKLNVFLTGLKEGYNTMDLLAAFFFSSTILTILRDRQKSDQESKQYIKTALRASFIGASLLAIIYIGFSYLACFHGHGLDIGGKEELLAAITYKIAGEYGGLLVCTSIAFACLTTAIALIASFCDFVQKEVFEEKVNYQMILSVSLLITFLMSTFEYKGIASFLGPILEICYPGLIVLTFLNIAFRLKNFKPIKIPVFFVFGLSGFFYFL